MLPLRQLSQGLGAKRVDGIIRTTLFYHFLATLDFQRAELVLRRKTANGPGAVYDGVIGKTGRRAVLDGE